MSKKYKMKVKKYIVQSDKNYNKDDIFEKIKIDVEKEKEEKKNKRKVIFAITLETLLIIILSLALIITIYNKNEEKPEVEETEEVEESVYLFLGDSITNQYKLSKFYPEFKVINSGINGNVTENILEDLDNRVFQHNPTDVILLIGINQLQRDDVEKIYNDIVEIVNNIKEHDENTTVYVQSVYPANPVMDGSKAVEKDNNKIKELNTKLKKYTEENDIPYIDVYDKLIDENGNLKEEYTEDGLHITEDAYLLITDEILKVINEEKEI